LSALEEKVNKFDFVRVTYYLYGYTTPVARKRNEPVLSNSQCIRQEYTWN
jgi:hypothetical protein